ncbi:hypothetical protein [Lentzea terrae]|uniref:hypothetical protein n=1 Tax=Lentzea terrae TaxID=2200761 RepID=UPI000DD4C389|nr:hypothetical protein [Lentzea terrae]
MPLIAVLLPGALGDQIAQLFDDLSTLPRRAATLSGTPLPSMTITTSSNTTTPSISSRPAGPSMWTFVTA